MCKPINLLLHGFEVQSKKPLRWFWGPNHQTINPSFEAQTKKLSQWFWCQTTDKPSPSVLRLNRKTHASRLLHVYDVDHTWHHPTSWSSDHRIPDLCLIIPDPPHQVPTPVSILIVAYHVAFTTYASRGKQMCFSTPNNWIWVSSTEIHRIQIQTRTSQLLVTHINQGINHLVSQSHPWWVHWQLQVHKVWILNSRPIEAQLNDQKPKTSLKMII
jgi:hypothetical protein